MFRNTGLIQLLAGSLLLAPACATAVDDGDAPANERDKAFEILQRTAGAPVSMELNEAGLTRVVAMTHGYAVSGHATDPVLAATNFLTANHDVFQLAASDVANFAVARVDVEPKLNMSHVTLQRTYNGIDVFQGALTVHMDGANGVFTALGDEFYKIAPPTNRMMLAPDEAALAAGRALGVSLQLSQEPSEAQGAVFTSPGTLDPVKVTQKIVQVADGDNRFGYQVLLSWLDDQKQQQYQLALVDAQDGVLLASYNLVNTFTGKVFNVNAQPTANQATDTRTEVSFDGNPTASPLGWVTTPANKTIGNNAVAATDLDGNNTVGTNETQPTANANDAFDFPYSATTERAELQGRRGRPTRSSWSTTTTTGPTCSASPRPRVTSRPTTTARAARQNDPVNVDAQDGSGTNNANFSTPPDGSRPRMQMFIFSIKNGAGGVTQDGDFDPSVIYHENTHGVSNRLVGGGIDQLPRRPAVRRHGRGLGRLHGLARSSTTRSSAPTSPATRRSASARRRWRTRPFTYNDIKNGTLAEVHDVGELWAATLWDVRKAIGAAIVEQLVISGMKLTPCNPTMLQARDAIIQADANINAGANRCKIWGAFAGRQMGTGASSPNTSSTIGDRHVDHRPGRLRRRRHRHHGVQRRLRDRQGLDREPGRHRHRDHRPVAARQPRRPRPAAARCRSARRPAAASTW